jgi:microcin C transport system substrate-binding protein
MRISRRSALQMASGACGAALLPSPGRSAPTAATNAGEIWGLSTFGDLRLPVDFKHFRYVNAAAPKGGSLSIQIKNTIGNQNFDTFDTFNIYVLQGDGAAGMDSTFDSLMSGSLDEPDALYGLVASGVSVSPDKLSYRFRLRPQARFHDGSRLTASDVAFSINTLKASGHPIYQLLLREMAACSADGDDIVSVSFTPKRSRDVHLFVAGLPIFSQTWWKGRDFKAATLEPPLGSGPYKVATWRQGDYVILDRVADYWGLDLPVNVGQNNFDRVKYTYYRDRTPAFEDFKTGRLNFQEEFTAKFWALSYDFPAVRDGRVKKEELTDGAPQAIQGWYFNTRRDQFRDPRIREALNYAFDFEWTNKNIMFSTYQRTKSFFSVAADQAQGAPGPDEAKLLEPWRGKISDAVFGPVWTPPQSDGSGFDRALLRQANDLLMAAGCKRQGDRLLLPSGKPFAFEFLDSQAGLQPHFQGLQANLRRLGIDATSRLVDAAQYKSRLDSFDFDFVALAMGGAFTPGDELRDLYSSEAAHTPGSHNLAGVSDPAVDALVDRIAKATTRADLDVACRALDRVLRANFYWIPMWYRNKQMIAYWDAFDRPAGLPTYGTGAPGIWWWDEGKARKIGVAG